MMDDDGVIRFGIFRLFLHPSFGSAFVQQRHHIVPGDRVCFYLQRQEYYTVPAFCPGIPVLARILRYAGCDGNEKECFYEPGPDFHTGEISPIYLAMMSLP